MVVALLLRQREFWAAEVLNLYVEQNWSCKFHEWLTWSQAAPSFQPQVPLPASSSTSITTPAVRKTLEPDLITRYNLQSKISAKGKEKARDSAPTGWAPSKDLRQQMLQRRRDEMILAARRRMQEKDEGSAGT